MKAKSSSTRLLQIAILLLLLAMGTHAYLAYHHYDMTFGSGGPSICNINSKFDCDAVNASSFSQVLGLPLALWGLMTNFALLLVLAGAMLLDDEAKFRWHRFGLILSGVVAGMSLVMGGISTFVIGTYCLFCMAAYFLSFLNLGLVWSAYQGSFFSHLADDLTLLLTQKRGLIFVLVTIPFGVWVFDQMALKSFVGGPISSLVQSSVQEWKATPTHDLSVSGPVLATGAEASQARVTLVEFADFRCPHCKEASPKLHAFVRSHPDVRLIFLTFPLDGECNPEIKHSSGVSCRLAKASYCAIENSKGWETHDFIFEHQAEFRSLDDVNRLLQPKLTEWGLDWNKVTGCIESPETHDRIVTRAKLAASAGLQGTPTVFVNGKMLNYGQILPILQAVYEEARR